MNVPIIRVVYTVGFRNRTDEGLPFTLSVVSVKSISYLRGEVPIEAVLFRTLTPPQGFCLSAFDGGRSKFFFHPFGPHQGQSRMRRRGT